MGLDQHSRVMADEFSGDDDFDAGDAGSALCHPCPVGDIKKGSHIAMKGLFFFFPKD